jgi:hypothetical protein
MIGKNSASNASGIEPKPHLFLGLDYGSSLTKGFYKSTLNSHVHMIAMEPELVELSRTSVENYMRDRLGKIQPVNSAWVGVGNEFRAVGFLAHRFHGEAGLRELKYERAVYKTLAAIWVASRNLGIEGPEIKLSLCCVLPPSEYPDRNRFESKLRASLREFIVPTGLIKVELVDFMCRPEGTGIYLSYQRIHERTILDSTFSILMLGYRNASVLSLRKGEFQPSVSSDYGFVRVIEAIGQRVSGLNFRAATAAIAQAGFPPDTKSLKILLRSQTEKGKQEDLAMLLSAIKNAREEYLEVLLRWLNSQLPEDTSSLVLGGGTAKYFQKELLEQITGYKVVQSTFNSIQHQKHKNGCDERFEDISKLFNYFLANIKHYA